MKTTLNQIRACYPCSDGWSKLLGNLGKTKADDEPLSIIQVLDSNGLDDALWCLQAVEGFEREKRLYAVRCARRVQHLMIDHRSTDALDVAERFANGAATKKELDVAAAAARAAAWAAEADAARSAAWAAAWAAEADAAWAAERDVAAAAARAAARAAAWDAEADAAADAERDVAADAARSAAEDVQKKDLREMCAACEVIV